MLQSTLGQLRLNNIATLDALTTHFTRLIDLTSADDDFVNRLAHSLAPCVLRPRTENTLTLEDRHAYRLIRDLFDHKEAIFGELKRQSSGGQNSVRHRAISTGDESQRRAHMEARQKAINEARRDRSPAPSNRHRRDKSTDGAPGRFPVVASPRPDSGRVVSGAPAATSNKRTSLEVPGSQDNSPVQPRTEKPSAPDQLNAQAMDTNGHVSPDFRSMPGGFGGYGPGPHIPPPREDDSPVSDVTPPDTSTSKVGSLKRSAMGSGRSGRALTRDEPVESGKGVQLVDKPMDDFS